MKETRVLVQLSPKYNQYQLDIKNTHNQRITPTSYSLVDKTFRQMLNGSSNTCISMTMGRYNKISIQHNSYSLPFPRSIIIKGKIA